MNSRNHKKVPNSVCSVNFPFQTVPGAPDSRFISDYLHGWEGSQKCATLRAKGIPVAICERNILLIPGS